MFDKKNGATMLTIPLAHTLAAVKDVLGDFGPLFSRFVSRFDTVKVTETGETRKKTAADQIMIHGTLESGAAVSSHYRGGVSRGTNLLWEINGTKGDIQVTGEIGHAQMIQLTVKGAREVEKELMPLMPAASLYEGWPESVTVRNVARIYSRLYDDIYNGTRTAPSFQDAVILHELIDRIEHAAVA
jgi:predicted dehydrogenase